MPGSIVNRIMIFVVSGKSFSLGVLEQPLKAGEVIQLNQLTVENGGAAANSGGVGAEPRGAIGVVEEIIGNGGEEVIRHGGDLLSFNVVGNCIYNSI